MGDKTDRSRPWHVLLVEDEQAIRLILGEALHDAGFQVTQAESGDCALAMLGALDDIDLLLTDVHMPGRLSGVDLAGRMRARWPEVPVVFFTGRPDAVPAMDTLGPRDRLVLKPCRSRALLNVVESSLAA